MFVFVFVFLLGFHRVCPRFVFMFSWVWSDWIAACGSVGFVHVGQWIMACGSVVVDC